MFQLKRVYEKASTTDGARILVDRLWPRGISKDKAQLTLWMRDIAPSDELRNWFGHDPQKWNAFQIKYKKELTTKKELFDQLKELKKKNKTVTLVYGAKDTEHNQAVVLLELLNKQ